MNASFRPRKCVGNWNRYVKVTLLRGWAGEIVNGIKGFGTSAISMADVGVTITDREDIPVISDDSLSAHFLLLRGKGRFEGPVYVTY